MKETIHRKSELMYFPSENKIDMISIITTVFYNLNGILVFWKYYILYNKNIWYSLLYIISIDLTFLILKWIKIMKIKFSIVTLKMNKF